MTEHFTHETILDASEAVEPQILIKQELDDMELQVRELLETDMTHDDLRAVVSALLEEKGQAPLAEGEDRRSFQLEIDGETIEQTVFIDPNDFGTFVRRAPQEMDVEDDETSDEWMENLNEEVIIVARHKLQDLIEDGQSERRALSSVVEDLAAASYRDDINLNTAEENAHRIWRRLNVLVEDAETTARALAAIEAELDTRSKNIATESNSLEQAVVGIRRATRMVEEEAIYSTRVLMGLIDEARRDPRSLEEYKARSRAGSRASPNGVVIVQQKVTRGHIIDYDWR